MSTLTPRASITKTRERAGCKPITQNRGAEAGAESNKQVTAEPRNCTKCRAHGLEVGKGECDGVQLESGDRGEIVLHSVEP